jgi:UDP-3-O-[3-hydroxymyristoyl] glucosamine N-acyltransferase
MLLSELAALVGGRLTGDPGAEVRDVARIEEAVEGQVTFLANPKYRRHLATTRATAVLVSEAGAGGGPPPGPALIAVRDPYAAFMKVLDHFHPLPPGPPPGIDPSARIAPSASIGAGASVGANAVISERCVVGDRAVVSHGAVMEAGSAIGDDTRLMENAVVKGGCRIGRRVAVYPGAVIGSDGFGFAPRGDGTWEKIPQRGIVVIEDDVEIGANCTIDRATLGETRICRGVKLDNLIMVGHNVVIGEDTVIAAQSGIAGSTRIGKHCVIAGQVGIVGHLTIADNVTIGAQSGVSRSLDAAGQTYFSSPAKEHRRALRIEGALRQLPELLEEVRAIRKELDRLTGSAGSGPPQPPDGTPS